MKKYTQRGLFAWFLVLSSGVPTGSCGLLGGPSGGQGNSTLDYLSKNGLPRIDDILPALPLEFSRQSGVDVGSDGLPKLQSSLPGVSIKPGSGAADFIKLANETTQMSMWGFSEARRLEALVRNFAGPVLSMLGESKLFSSLNQGGQSSNPGLMQDSSASGFVGNLFGNLLSQASFSVALPERLGFPTHLVLSAPRGANGVSVEALWPTGSALNTGMLINFALSGQGSGDIEIAFAPGMMKGLVKSWTGNTCADDLFSMKISRDVASGLKSFTLNSFECPKTRNALGTLTLAGKAGRLLVGGGFAQNFDLESLSGPRKYLGARQGVLLQTGINSEGSENFVASSVAVAKESDLKSLSASKILEKFGVANLLANYLVSEYWKPINSSRSADPTNMAFWMCGGFSFGPSLVDFLSSSSKSTLKDLCADKEVDAEPMLSAFSDVESAMSSVPSSVSDVVAPVSYLAKVLSVRNVIFANGNATHYKSVSGSQFKSADSYRAEATLPSEGWLSGTPESIQSKFRTVEVAKLPTIAFGASSSNLGEFARSTCSTLITDALSKAGKPQSGSTGCE